MKLYLDIHKNAKGITKEALEEGHKQDLKVQGKYGVKFKGYWYNEAEGKIFCLLKAPNKEAAKAVHREAHGGVADEVIEVKAGH